VSNPSSTAQALYAQISSLIQTMPDLTAMGPLSGDTLRWLGRAQVLVEHAEGVGAKIEFQTHRNTLEQNRHIAAERIAGLLYRALAAVETMMPAPFEGAFIPAGNTFDAMTAVTKIFARAKAELLIVDPYLDEKILTEFAPLAPAGVKLKLLCDEAGYKQTLTLALSKWVQQYGVMRPIEARAARARTLHDRLVAVDGTLVWTVGQCNALATRAPTSFVQSDTATAELKIRAYGEDIWSAAKSLIP
jgi:hypothetical protein